MFLWQLCAAARGPPKSLGIMAPVSLATLVLVTFGAGTDTEERACFFLLSADARALANWLRFLRDHTSQTTQKHAIHLEPLLQLSDNVC